MNRQIGWGLFVAAGSLLTAGFIGLRPDAPAQGSAGKAILVLSTDCPVAQKYTPRINALHEKYSAKGFAFEAIFPNDLETRSGIQKYFQERSYQFPFSIDFGAERAKKLGVTVLPAILIYDSKGNLAYQGAIDDNKDVTLVKEHFAVDAFDAVLSGKKAAKTRTECFGCVLMPGEAPPKEGEATYAEHVAQIFNDHCVTCHRPGEVAPFSMTDYANAKKWAPMIEQAATARRMPPWKAVHGFGEFKDENRLTEVEIETIRRWVKAGAPRGNSEKEPVPPVFNPGWRLGEPDLVLQPASEFKLEAEGDDVYRHFVLKTDFKETRYVKALDVKPGNKQVVHHVIAFIDERGVSHAKDGQGGQPGYNTNGGGPGFIPNGSFGGWAPGVQVASTPSGTAFELKPGATIVLQVHYHKSGKPETDLTKIGLYFAKEKIERTMEIAWMANPMFRIPAGAEAHPVRLNYPIPADVTLYSVMPHMHLLGRQMKATAVFPDGTERPLIFVDDWDFNWQLVYALKEPMKLPKGSRVKIEAVYDNSTKNPYNPHNPPKAITWGEQTTDEMFLLVVAYTLDNPSTSRAFGGGF
ncbi:MAG TPA: redoxin domain-containing protein [Fimbriimonadaceae bacterium]|nr:redoxin domain-containing protein [Fimbriimonadaceae bacterium]